MQISFKCRRLILYEICFELVPVTNMNLTKLKHISKVCFKSDVDYQQIQKQFSLVREAPISQNEDMGGTHVESCLVQYPHFELKT